MVQFISNLFLGRSKTKYFQISIHKKMLFILK